MLRKQTRRAFDALTAMAFTLAISVPGSMMLIWDEVPDVSLENRLPAKKPEWPADKAALAEFPRAFEAYFNDYFGLRKQLNRAQQVVYFRIFGISPNKVVVTGKEGSLFLAGEIENLRQEHPVPEAELARTARILQERHDWLAARGIKYLVVLVPNKATIYPELTPDSVRPLHPKGLGEQVTDYLQSHTNVAVLNLTGPLRDAKPQGQLYPRLDAHWNEYGAFIAYRAIIEKLSAWFPNLTPIPEERCIVEVNQSSGDLCPIIGFPELTEPRTFMRLTERRAKGLEVWLGGDHISTVDDPTLPRAVVFHDSFLTAERFFLAEHFQAARYLWVYGDFDVAAINDMKPNVVIQQMIERAWPHRVTENPPEVTAPTGSPTTPPQLATGPETTTIE